MVKLEVNIQKKDLWLLSAVIVFMVGVGVVIAYNAGFSGGTPSVMGHSSDEIQVVFNGTEQSLQSALSKISVGGGFGGGGMSFGDWTRTGTLASGGAQTMVAGNVYEAQTDGIITAYEGGSMIAYIDSDLTKVTSGSLTVKRVQSSDSTNAPSVPSFTFPVKKGDYFKITNAYYGAPIIWWVPVISSGGFIPDTYTGQESITFPNGMIMKMGKHTGTGEVRKVFAEDFPNALVSVVVTEWDDVGVSGSLSHGALEEPINKHEFTFQVHAYQSGFYWTAIGY